MFGLTSQKCANGQNIDEKFFWNRMGATLKSSSFFYICPEVFNVLLKIGDSRFAIFWTKMVISLYKELFWIPHKISFQMNSKKVSLQVLFDMFEVPIFHIWDISNSFIKCCSQITMLADFATWVIWWNVKLGYKKVKSRFIS